MEYIKNIVSQAKVYIRPIQKNLSLDTLCDNNRDLVCLIMNCPIGSDQCYYCYLQSCAPTEKCMECGMTVTLYQLREREFKMNVIVK